VEEYLDSFEIDMALKFCERALQLEPNNLYVLDTMAPLLLEAGESDRAFEV
jgi:Tfp pilus assembly protein PilF